jgi:membrane protease YdiL (CAAX protease family)
MTAAISTEARPAPNWRHVGVFLGLTFGLTWLLDLVIYLRGGLTSMSSLTVLQFQMLLPAFSAIFLGLFFFRESPIHRSRDVGRGRWFYYYFLGLTIIFGVGVVAAWFTSSQATVAVVSSILQLLAVVGLFLLVILRLVAGRDAMARAWLSWGNWRNYLIFGVAIVAYYVLQAVLNVVFRIPMTAPVGITIPPGMTPTTFWIVGGVQTVLLAPILAIVISFGEEYGWRGYLQNELFKWGRVRGCSCWA